MKIRNIALAISLLCVLSSCQMGNTFENNIQNTNDEHKNVVGKVKLIYEQNNPLPEGDIWYGVTECVPGYIEVESGTEIEIAGFEGKMEKYIGSSKTASYSFDSWNTIQDGSGEKYLAGSIIKLEEDTTLYAIYNMISEEAEMKKGDKESIPSVSLETMLIGKWVDDKNYILLNPDFTGILSVKAHNGAEQYETFTWTAVTVANGTKYLKVDNCSDDALNKLFTIKRISSTSMTLDGYFAVFSSKTTTWIKEL